MNEDKAILIKLLKVLLYPSSPKAIKSRTLSMALFELPQLLSIVVLQPPEIVYSLCAFNVLLTLLFILQDLDQNYHPLGTS
jgi:hypothetical protein